eukprot:TRINITY_DN9806_c0_g1_i12.p1 TRINITY_DN9806_c0_g1~~TRINITY_DN9806_c0_g1_i12.p1  ORF type:complete len:374 (-),score=143.26 TRINITY_DN9806_c0_g1_i12:105-1226(-)
MDSRTRIILLKLIKKQLLDEVSGCISTGKEANVYHALNASEEEFAVKIYKTSILVFKDRNRYVDGEYRFRRGYCRHNPRKMVAMWAEKEFRNLSRMRAAGIAVPLPVAVKGHVLVMEFLGKHMIAASTLKEVSFETLEEWEETYVSVVEILRMMYHSCKLVHADFSEYNLLLHQSKVYVIDVSQAVEFDHPMALEFLRRDCANINSFFESKGTGVFGLKQLFYLIVDKALKFSRERVRELLKERKEGVGEEDRFSDALFKELHIPRTLFEVEPEKLFTASEEQLDIIKRVAGFDEGNLKEMPETIREEHSGDSESSEEDKDEEKTEEKAKKKDPFEGMSKKERKQKVKLEKREKRKNKVPKHIKKKAEKKNHK